MILKSGFKHEDLLKLAPEELSVLAGEVRKKIVETVCRNGGHLASSLCAVDLIIAMLRRFDPVRDRIIFDVGHQSYAYKILTDRFDRFDTLRTKGGLSGFPRRAESPCDHFDTGHSSTSISAALGYARARDLLGEKRHVIAFIGDASLINGLALEALNYVEETGTKLIIVLNDNKHSISNRVGGFSTVLAHLSANTAYNKIKSAVKDCCKVLSKGGGLQRKLEGIHAQIKNLVKPENIFDDLGINYWGPFDGHDIRACEVIFELAKNYDKPVLLHFSTEKGKGLPEAEADPTKYHQVSPGTVLASQVSQSAQNLQPTQETPSAKNKTWSDTASAIMEELAAQDPKIVCFTAAMSTGVKLEHFRKHFPERFFDVGIAESHMLTMAAGLAAGGIRPWVFIYSTFLQRAMDQAMHDIALQNLPVVLMVDRAGLVGSDGETHQGLLDVPWFNAMPNFEIYAPSDEASLREMMLYAATRNAPTLIRYPRGTLSNLNLNLELSCSVHEKNDIQGSEIGPRILCGDTLKGALLLGHGMATQVLLEAHDLAVREGLPEPTVIDLQRLKPLDSPVLDDALSRADLVVTAEENYLSGGIGSAIAVKIAENGLRARLRRFGVPDVCVEHATPEEQREVFGLTARNIVNSLRQIKN